MRARASGYFDAVVARVRAFVEEVLTRPHVFGGIELAFGRNQRLRRALLPTPPPATVSLPAVLLQTTAEDIAVLDARFPWLRGAERRVTRRPAHAASDDRRAA